MYAEQLKSERVIATKAERITLLETHMTKLGIVVPPTPEAAAEQQQQQQQAKQQQQASQASSSSDALAELAATHKLELKEISRAHYEQLTQLQVLLLGGNRIDSLIGLAPLSQLELLDMVSDSVY